MAWNEKRTLAWVLTSQASATLVITRKSPTFAGWLWLLVVSMVACAIGHGGGGSGGTTTDARGAGPEEVAGEVERGTDEAEATDEDRAELEVAGCGGGVRGATEDVEASGGVRDGGNGGNAVGMASSGAAFGPAAQAPSTQKNKATRARVRIRGV